MFAWKFSFILLLASFCFANVRVQDWANISGGNTIASDILGNNFVSSSTDNVIYQIISGDTVQSVVYAGTGTAGFLDGPLSTAQFNQPMGITVSFSSGYMYVCDYGNNAIRRISGGNVITVATGITQPIQVIAQTYQDNSGRKESPVGVYVLTASGEVIIVDDSPLNDVCENAVNIIVPVGSISINGTTVNARGDGYIPCNALSEYGYRAYMGQAGVWYTMYGNGNQFTISTCNSGTGPDIAVFIYRDSSPNVSSLCTSLVCMTLFDEYFNENTCLHNGGSTDICTQEGLAYYFFVNSYYSEESQFVLTITDNGPANCSSCACENECGPSSCYGYCEDTCSSSNTTCIEGSCVETIPNENCLNAVELVGNTTTSGDLSKVSTLPPVVIAEGSCDFLYQGGYWYSFNATQSTWVTLSFCNEASRGGYPYVAVYSVIPGVPCDENLLCVEVDESYCENYFNYEIYHFCPIPGTTYYFYVTSFDTRHTFELDQEITENPCSPGESYYQDYYTSFTSFA